MKTSDILFIIGTVIALALLFWYLFGNSPTMEQLLLGLGIANLTFTFKIYGDIQRHLGEHDAARKKGDAPKTTLSEETFISEKA